VGETGLLFFPVKIEDKKGGRVGSGVWNRRCGHSDNTGTAETVWGTTERSTACAALAPLRCPANVPEQRRERSQWLPVQAGEMKLIRK